MTRDTVIYVSDPASKDDSVLEALEDAGYEVARTRSCTQAIALLFVLHYSTAALLLDHWATKDSGEVPLPGPGAGPGLADTRSAFRGRTPFVAGRNLGQTRSPQEYGAPADHGAGTTQADRTAFGQRPLSAWPETIRIGKQSDFSPGSAGASTSCARPARPGDRRGRAPWNPRRH